MLGVRLSKPHHPTVAKLYFSVSEKAGRILVKFNWYLKIKICIFADIGKFTGDYNY